MASEDLLVLLAALLVGLVMGGLLGWASLLLRTGHPPRPQQGEPPSARRARPPTAPATGPPPALAVVLLLAAVAVIFLVAPSTAPWPLEGGEVPGGPVVVAAVAVVAALVLAATARRGVGS
jgi:hypothetical protein